MKTGHYQHMTKLGGGRNATIAPATGEVVWTNPYDIDLTAKTQAFREARLFWVYRIALLVIWIGLQVVIWKAMTSDLKPRPPGLGTVVLAACGIVFGGIAVALMAYVVGRFIAVAVVAVIGLVLGVLFAIVDLLLIRPALRFARITWLVKPLAVVSFVISAVVTIQDLLT